VSEDAVDWRAIFTEEFAAAGSTVHARIWAEVFGEEYPAEVEPYSYTSRTELARFAKDVNLAAGELLVDVGSGRGGPGLWVAAHAGASYLAVDIAASGLAQVQARAERLGLAERVRVAEGSFESLPLEDAEAAAIMSIDALLFTPDKACAVRELARVLRPGGRVVFTTWDYSRQPAGRPPQVADHQPLLVDAGLDVLVYEETPDWERRHRETNRLLLASVEELAAESDEPVEEVRAQVEEMAATLDAILRRVYVVAERPR
jgi:SAM-dependent methyltransferase